MLTCALWPREHLPMVVPAAASSRRGSGAPVLGGGEPLHSATWRLGFPSSLAEREVPAAGAFLPFLALSATGGATLEPLVF
jgi:hypothetical protein